MNAGSAAGAAGAVDAGRLRVAVIGGGRNCEHEVSLASAAAAHAALDRDRYHPVALTIRLDGSWLIDGRPADPAAAVAVLGACDVALPLVHGVAGEDGSLAALCEFAGVPYAGSGVGAGALGMDKWATKQVAASVGIATAPGYLVPRGGRCRPWTGPVVVKPVRAGSSHGVALVTEEAGLAPAVAAAAALDDRVLVEEVLTGREIDIAVLGSPGGPPVLSPALEIVVAAGLFDYAAKYGGGADFRVPAPLPDHHRQELERQAVAVYQALGCAGLARVDFFLTDAGWVLNEINTAPGLTRESQVPRMFAAAGLGYPQLLDRMICTALSTGGGRGERG